MVDFIEEIKVFPDLSNTSLRMQSNVRRDTKTGSDHNHSSRATYSNIFTRYELRMAPQFLKGLTYFEVSKSIGTPPGFL
jgi:hypothetical protein